MFRACITHSINLRLLVLPKFLSYLKLRALGELPLHLYKPESIRDSGVHFRKIPNISEFVPTLASCSPLSCLPPQVGADREATSDVVACSDSGAMNDDAWLKALVKTQSPIEIFRRSKIRGDASAGRSFNACSTAYWDEVREQFGALRDEDRLRRNGNL